LQANPFRLANSSPPLARRYIFQIRVQRAQTSLRTLKVYAL